LPVTDKTLSHKVVSSTPRQKCDSNSQHDNKSLPPPGVDIYLKQSTMIINIYQHFDTLTLNPS